ncbi:MGDG synthase family glycosyltransferase [Scopulibacillus darangshiensis]|nr:glycosyltransferase [Scopulibacillus darangshiensis]
MKILFLPLFKMPSGHHRVADAMIDMLKQRSPKIQCKKVDLLSYSSSGLEKAVSGLYLKWIHHTPGSYDWAYKHFAYTRSHHHCSFMGLERYFLFHLEKLMKREQPDLVVCTHGFPSLLMSRLKEKGRVHIPVINAYTDFFINDIWGRSGIDYHLVPNKAVKKRLVEHYHVEAPNIIVTGIPVHETFMTPSEAGRSRANKKVLVAGGSSGLGDIVGLINQTSKDSAIQYTILCGKNQKLLDEIKGLQLPNVTALTYVSSREEMNMLYNEADAIVTKPGGVTISEALRKRLPIFIHSALPGQEFINLQYLEDKHLVYKLKTDESLEKQISEVFSNDIEIYKRERAIESFLSEQDVESTDAFSNFITAKARDGVFINKAKAPLPASLINKLKKYAKKLAFN